MINIVHVIFDMFQNDIWCICTTLQIHSAEYFDELFMWGVRNKKWNDTRVEGGDSNNSWLDFTHQIVNQSKKHRKQLFFFEFDFTKVDYFQQKFGKVTLNIFLPWKHWRKFFATNLEPSLRRVISMWLVRWMMIKQLHSTIWSYSRCFTADECHGDTNSATINEAREA